jgi:hypothetical protein
MREYQTTGIIRVNCGYIGLDKHQAGARRSRVRQIRDGVYEVLQPIEFKAGEKIRLDNPDKITLARMDCLDKPIPEPAKTPAPAKKPAAKKVNSE